jgi:hypothetical protein
MKGVSVFVVVIAYDIVAQLIHARAFPFLRPQEWEDKGLMLLN